MTGRCSLRRHPGCCSSRPPARALLGVPGTATTQRAFLAAYRRFRYCFHAILSVMDPSALPKKPAPDPGPAGREDQENDPGPGADRIAEDTVPSL